MMSGPVPGARAICLLRLPGLEKIAEVGIAARFSVIVKGLLRFSI
jgi:hypothetical protein